MAHHICETGTPMDEFIAPSLLVRLGITPVKFVSIRLLELQAAVLATRMFKMLQEELELNISRTYL